MPSHLKQEAVDEGRISQLDRDGNARADYLAKQGAAKHAVSETAIQHHRRYTEHVGEVLKYLATAHTTIVSARHWDEVEEYTERVPPPPITRTSLS